ncbi:zinc-dependent metalloprotease [Sphingomonas hankyongi]|uniref:Zinc-dependent metalloprotease n=1 Tax=Sphingomonas hankyongi TaxID=2908209 RepID=A0ABT0RXX8_9SPHN|nr:zinc-dependent metalloprotease [Sphingomonas hankyongi]MCL6728469.1 zinc-dependent metalloprotease [Sphingomonas hankyongi]
MKSKSFRLLAFALSTCAPCAVTAVPVKTSSVSEPVLLQVKAEPATGKIIASFPKPDAQGVAGRYIYLSQLETGLGSAPVGLDRARPSDSRLLVFRRIGKKVAAEIENPKFVASSGNAEEVKAVRESFATSTIWVGDVVDSKPDGSFTVDLAGFLARDDGGIAKALKQGGGGTYKFAPELSAADPNFVKVFPDNAEFAARLTFRSDEPTGEVTNIIPDSDSVTLVLRHSLIRLPAPGYVPRTDPFGYSIGRQQLDFSAPLGASVVRDVASRFRLEKTDPTAARSPVKKPIIFYIDRGAPEPMRTALREGVSWWNQAFDAAGFVDAFRAEILPEGADPLDVRYNMVNWVNRATRGWSYGSPISDPRTGEIIKGSVLLGSLRARQDMLIFQALVGAGLTGTGNPDDPITATLARIRQLGAHEVGHAIGLQHNMAASSQDRFSVMDYPAPRVGLKDGAPSLLNAYGVGVGPWDKWVIKWLYGARTDAEAAPILSEARAAGLRFVADQDSRPVSSGHPSGALWDDAADSVGELKRIMDVRRVALQRFGRGSIPAGESLAGLRRAFVPMWLLGRYQVEAASKSLGGVDFPYSLAGENLEARPVPAAAQWAALYALLDTLTPGELTVPSNLQPLLSAGFGGNDDRQTEIEIIPTAGGPVFDPLEATEIGAVQTLQALLDPQRLNRLEIQHSSDSNVPDPARVSDMLIDHALAGSGTEVGRRIATTTILALARVQRDPALSPTIALQLSGRLDRLANSLDKVKGRDAAVVDWSRGFASLLRDREALDKAIADPKRLPRVPPGMPIGMDEVL